MALPDRDQSRGDDGFHAANGPDGGLGGHVTDRAELTAAQRKRGSPNCGIPRIHRRQDG